jgi:diacylglycerol kinase (ATP)
MLAAVGNGVSYGGGMRVCEGAVIDDGLLQVTWLHESSKFHFVTTFPKVFKGTHIADPGVTQHAGRRIRIEAPGQLAYADGDRMGELPIDIEVHPGGLRVLTADGQ